MKIPLTFYRQGEKEGKIYVKRFSCLSEKEMSLLQIIYTPPFSIDGEVKEYVYDTQSFKMIKQFKTVSKSNHYIIDSWF